MGVVLKKRDWVCLRFKLIFGSGLFFVTRLGKKLVCDNVDGGLPRLVLTGFGIMILGLEIGLFHGC